MKRILLTTAILAMASPALAGNLSDLGLADPVIEGDREVTDDCRVPIRSERTGEILYYNWADPSCWTPKEDGDNPGTPTKQPPSCEGECGPPPGPPPGCRGECGPKGPPGDKPKNPNKGGGNGPEGGDPGNNPDNGNDDE